MIDWATFTIYLVHDPIPAGRVMRISPDGAVEWDSPARTTIKGSFDECMEVRSQGELNQEGRATELYVSGNPSKFLQFHNVFGSFDLRRLVMTVMHKLSSFLGTPIPSWSQVDNAKLHRIDITRSFQFPTRTEARAYVRALSLKANSRLGRPTLRGWTCYFGKHSRRWSFKIYTKGDELDKHKLHTDLDSKDDIYQFADNLARAELTLRSMELEKLEKRIVKDWPEADLIAAYSEYSERIEMTPQVTLPSDVISNIPRCYRDTYLMWERGINVFTTMKQTTFYRHRAELLHYGVDIGIPRDTDSGVAEILPIFQMIQGRLAETPNWAFQRGLIFNPNQMSLRLVS